MANIWEGRWASRKEKRENKSDLLGCRWATLDCKWERPGCNAATSASRKETSANSWGWPDCNSAMLASTSEWPANGTD